MHIEAVFVSLSHVACTAPHNNIPMRQFVRLACNFTTYWHSVRGNSICEHIGMTPRRAKSRAAIVQRLSAYENSAKVNRKRIRFPLDDLRRCVVNVLSWWTVCSAQPSIDAGNHTERAFGFLDICFLLRYAIIDRDSWSTLSVFRFSVLFGRVCGFQPNRREGLSQWICISQAERKAVSALNRYVYLFSFTATDSCVSHCMQY